MEEIQRQNIEERSQLTALLQERLHALPQEISEAGLGLDYDPEEDTLFVYLGTEPQDAITEYLVGNVYLRLDANRLVGFEILKLKRWIETSQIGALFKDIYPALVQYRALILPPHAAESQQFAGEFARALADMVREKWPPSAITTSGMSDL